MSLRTALFVSHRDLRVGASSADRSWTWTLGSLPGRESAKNLIPMDGMGTNRLEAFSDGCYCRDHHDHGFGAEGAARYHTGFVAEHGSAVSQLGPQLPGGRHHVGESSSHAARRTPR